MHYKWPLYNLIQINKGNKIQNYVIYIIWYKLKFSVFTLLITHVFILPFQLVCCFENIKFNVKSFYCFKLPELSGWMNCCLQFISSSFWTSTTTPDLCKVEIKQLESCCIKAWQSFICIAVLLQPMLVCLIKQYKTH